MEDRRKLWLMHLADGETSPGDPGPAGWKLDPAEAEELASLARQRALLRAAFPTDEEGLAPMRATIERAFAARRRRSWSVRDMALPLAASLVTAMLVGVGTILVADYRTESATNRLMAALQRDRELMATAFAEALDRSVSGQSIAWHNPDSGRSGKVTPLRTFRGADGRWCREYEEEIVAPGGREREIGIACRESRGWEPSPNGAGT